MRITESVRGIALARPTLELRYSGPVHIGLVVYGQLDQVSGGNLYDQILVEHLRGRGHDVAILSLPHGSYARHLAQNFSPSLKRRLQERYDVLLQDELTHPSLFRANRAASAPIVGIVHHLLSSEAHAAWQTDLYRRIEERYLKTVGAFVFNSHTTRESVEELLGKKTQNVVATPGGDRLGAKLTGPEIYQRALAEGPLRILFVGNLIERKGLHVLLEALAKLRDQAWHLDIVGSEEMDPAYASRMQQKVDALDLRSRLTLYGVLAGERLAERYLESQLLVVPSSYEGFGIVYLEALGFGVPVIASAAGATDEIVHHESNGFLIQPGDTLSLSRQLERILEDRGLLGRLSLAALESFHAHPTWEQSMDLIETFLKTFDRDSP